MLNGLSHKQSQGTGRRKGVLWTTSPSFEGRLCFERSGRMSGPTGQIRNQRKRLNGITNMRKLISLVFLVLSLLYPMSCEGQNSGISNSIIREATRLYEDSLNIKRDMKGLYKVEFVSTVSYDSLENAVWRPKIKGIVNVEFVNSEYDFEFPAVLTITTLNSHPIVVYFGFERQTSFDPQAMKDFLRPLRKYLEVNPTVAYPRIRFNFINGSVVPRKE